MTSFHAPARRRPSVLTLALWVLAGGAVALGGLLFFLVNDTWVPVLIPRVPWSDGPAATPWEAHFLALVLVPLVLGAALALGLAWRTATSWRRLAMEHRDRAARLEAEIEKVSRLLSSSRSGGETPS
jgi:hypothetical protein